MSKAKFICHLCKRKFASQELLERHEQLSQLHKDNLAKQKEELLERKMILRQTLRMKRQAFVEREAEETAQDVTAGGTLFSSMNRRQEKHDLVSEIKGMEDEMGRIQEKLEKDNPPASALHQRYEKSDGDEDIRFLANPVTKEMIRFSCSCATWWGNKEFQEDRYVEGIEISSEGFEGVLYAVLDGHNGGRCADYVEEHLAENIRKCIATKQKPISEDNLKRAVSDAFILTDADFLKIAFANQMLDGSTCVLHLFYVDDDGKVCLLTAHCGDSRGVLCAGPVATRLSEDHKPDREDETERIVRNGGIVSSVTGVPRVFTPAPVAFGGKVSQWGLAVSRSFGDLPLKDPNALLTVMPDLNVVKVTKEHTMLITACDGIWDVMDDTEAAQIGDATKTSPAALEIVRQSYGKGSEDNLTALAIKMTFEAPVEGREVEPAAKRART